MAGTRDGRKPVSTFKDELERTRIMIEKTAELIERLRVRDALTRRCIAHTRRSLARSTNVCTEADEVPRSPKGPADR